MSTFRARRGVSRILTTSILTVSAALAAGPAGAETIGITSAVNLNAVGTPPAQDTRVLQVGLDMFANEKVDTGQVGQTHLIFDDGSALTIGPNSSVVLDEFVYDPEAQSGRLVVSVGKGLMRFVGGKISKKTPVLFKTPSSVIGIRGGIALIEANTPAAVGAAQDQGRDAPLSSVTLIYGKDAFLQSGDRTERMTRPGSQIVQQLDRTVLPPAPVSPDMLQNALNRLEETGDADPGEFVTALGASPQALAQLAPAAGPNIGDEDIADWQIADLGSDNDPNSLVPVEPNEDPVDFQDPPETVDPQQVGGGGPPISILPDPPTPTIEEPFPPVLPFPPGAVTGALKRAENPAFGADFFSLGSSPFVSVSSLDGDIFDATLLAGGSLSLPIGTGTFPATATVQPFGASPLDGIGVLSDSGDFLFYELEDPSDGSRVLAYAGNPTPVGALPTSGVTAYELRDDFAAGGVQIPFVSPFAGVGLINAGQTPTAYINWNSDSSQPSEPVVPALYSSSIVIQGQGLLLGEGQTSVANVIVGGVFGSEFGFDQPFIIGASRGSASNTEDTIGYVGLAVSGFDGTSNSFYGQNGPENFVLQSINNFVLPPEGEDIPFGANSVATQTDAGDAGSQQSSRTITGYFNGFTSEFDTSGELIEILGNSNIEGDTNGFRITTRPDTNQVFVEIETFIGPNASGDTLIFGDSLAGTFNLRSAYIDDRRFAAIESVVPNTYGAPLDTSEDRPEIAYVVTADQISFDDALPNGVTICNCEFTTWGFFGLGVDFASGETSETHLMPWVAGDIAEASQFASAPSSATYVGTVVGTTVLGQLTDPNATMHKAFGNIELNFSFSGGDVGVSSGTITGYDGGTIALLGNDPPGAPGFNFVVDTGASNIPGVFAIAGGGGEGVFVGPGSPPQNAIGTGGITGSLTDNLSNQDYTSNFVLFTERDGLTQLLQ